MSAAEGFVIRQLTGEAVRPLRHAVLRAGKPYETTRFQGDNDPETVHFGGFMAGILVGVASLYHEPPGEELLSKAGVQGDPAFACEPDRYWRLRGMAVQPEWRGHRIGSGLLHAVEREVHAHGPGMLWFTARSGALQFYTRHGYRTLGMEFEMPGIGAHHLALKSLG